MATSNRTAACIRRPPRPVRVALLSSRPLSHRLLLLALLALLTPEVQAARPRTRATAVARETGERTRRPARARSSSRQARPRVLVAPFAEDREVPALRPALLRALREAALRGVAMGQAPAGDDEGKLSARAVRRALVQRRARALVHGAWEVEAGGPTLCLVAYARDGRPHYLQRYPAGRDAAALAARIAADLARALPGLARRPVVQTLAPSRALRPLAEVVVAAAAEPAAAPGEVSGEVDAAVAGAGGGLWVQAHASVASLATSNLYLTREAEADLVLRPAAELQLRFARTWGAGYGGGYSHHLAHTALRAHDHHVFVYTNPAWGGERPDEVLLQAGLETLRNEPALAQINLLRPYLLAKGILWLLPSWRLVGSASASYRWFYDDPASSAAEAQGGLSAPLNLPTRTTVEPGLSAGVRYHPLLGAVAGGDRVDTYAELWLHLGQGLWPRAGLQLDYAYHHVFGPSGLMRHKLTLEQYAYLGEEFCYRGHRAHLGLKQVLPWRGLSTGLGVDGEQRSYPDLPALDDQGRLRGGERVDWFVAPRAWLRYQWFTDEATPGWLPAGSVLVEYQFARRFSNSAWFEGDRHLASAGLQLGW